jgi:hypothetical protein
MELKPMQIARSSAECHLYIDLHPCACGDPSVPAPHRLESRDHGLVAVYAGPCPRCGTARRFELTLDPEIVPAGTFGGTQPSQLIDAGQYLAVADAAARAVPANTSRLDDRARQQARAQMRRAVAALEEVLKFIPPGAEHVPGDALFSAAGKALHQAEPGRFRKARLEAVLRAYRDAEGQIAG